MISHTTILKAIKNSLVEECAYRSGGTWRLKLLASSFNRGLLFTLLNDASREEWRSTTISQRATE